MVLFYWFYLWFYLYFNNFMVLFEHRYLPFQPSRRNYEAGLALATMRGQGGTSQFKLVQYLQTCIYVRHSYLYHMSLLSPRHVVQHDHINASKHAQSVMGPGCSNDHKGCELCIIANRHNQELR